MSSCDQVHELAQSHCGDKQDGPLFLWVYIECVETEKKKLETHFVKTFLKRAIFQYYTYHVVYVYVIEHHCM